MKIGNKKDLSAIFKILDTTNLLRISHSTHIDINLRF